MTSTVHCIRAAATNKSKLKGKNSIAYGLTAHTKKIHEKKLHFHYFRSFNFPVLNNFNLM